MSTISTCLPVLPDGVPESMRAEARWLIWRSEARDGRPTKVPYRSNRPSQRASATDPVTWGTFDAALATYKDLRTDGIGFVLGDGFVGIDLDHSVIGGVVNDVGRAALDALGTYAELSPSGTGLHILARGVLPTGARRRGSVEAYDSGRYFTVTGHRLPDAPPDVADCTRALAAWHAVVFGENDNGGNGHLPHLTVAINDDAVLIDRARRAANGAKFDTLWAGDWTAYPSQSEADGALCTILAFWTDRDPARIDRLFRRSGLMRPKWDEQRGAQTYGERTIAKAMATCSETHAGRPAPVDGEAEREACRMFNLTDSGNAELLEFVIG